MKGSCEISNNFYPFVKLPYCNSKIQSKNNIFVQTQTTILMILQIWWNFFNDGSKSILMVCASDFKNWHKMLFQSEADTEVKYKGKLRKAICYGQPIN